MFDISDLRPTIIPKSDQMNAEQLLSGSMTITVSDVRVGSADQPVIIHFDGDEGRPFKPSKTMRKVLIFAWGADGNEWVGKSMTLFNDESVRFGGAQVGGIRISHLSDIERDISLSLTATKGKKSAHTIKVLRNEDPSLDALMIAINNADSIEALQAAFAAAYRATKAEQQRATFKTAYEDRKTALTPSA